MVRTTISALLALLSFTGCTINFQVSTESASTRDGTVSETEKSKETSETVVDVKADVTGK